MDMRKEFEINGCVEVPPELTADEFYDIFIAFVESQVWFFGGFAEIQDGYYILPDGRRGRPVFADEGQMER